MLTPASSPCGPPGNDGAAMGGAPKGKAKSGASKESNNNTSSFSIRFCYLPALGIVAVCPQAGCSPSLLANLFPNDTGRDTPNPINHHGRAARASASGVFNYPADVQCRPYRWAQWLAGLQFPPPGDGAAAVGGVTTTVGDGEGPGPIEPSTRAVVAALRSRIRTHMALVAQLRSFVTTGPSPLSSVESEVPRATGNVELRRCGWLPWMDIEPRGLCCTCGVLLPRRLRRRSAWCDGYAVEGDNRLPVT